MPRRYSLLVGMILTSATCLLSLPVQGDPPTASILPPAAALPMQPKQAVPLQDLSRLPLSFESNQGQTDSRVRFLTHSSDNALFLTPSEAVFLMPMRPKPQSFSLHKGFIAASPSGKSKEIALRMQIVGANSRATTLQQQPMAGKVNYLLGNDRTKWHTGVPTFGRVGFRGVYPGVDLVYYGNRRNLEYDFLVAPHADPKQIHLHFAGAQGVHLNAAGDLIVRTQGREWTWRKPAVYQQVGNFKKAVPAHFRLMRSLGGRSDVGFALGEYDRSHPLVIDPVLLYSTYVGGTAPNGEKATAIALDSSGNAYITGSTLSTDFPTTSGAFQQLDKAMSGNATAFVTKLNANGTALVYSTYLGGSERDIANAIAVDSSGNAYVTGQTSSTDFPVTPLAVQPYKTAGADYNAFVTKLNATGSSLLGSTYVGGGNSDSAMGIALDSTGNVYITGTTASTDFPTTSGAFQRANKAKDGTTCFVAKLNALLGNYTYSTFLGGSQQDGPKGIAIDTSGNAYLAGYTQSADFPVTPGAFQTTNKTATGSYTGFVAKLNPGGTALVYSTYLGGRKLDFSLAIAVDGNADAYVTGFTYSSDFYTTPNAFQRTFKATQPNSGNAFVTKFNATGTSVLYSTYLGGSVYDLATGLTIDSAGEAYVTGYTGSPDFPSTLGAFQRGYKGGSSGANGFVTKLNSTGTALLYSTYLGGNGYDTPTGITIDSSGHAYVTGSASSTDFPITSGAFQTSNHTGNGTGFVTKLSTIPVFPDFNNDGYSDLLIQNSSTSQIASWFMHGPFWQGGAYFSQIPTGFTLVGVGDFSGNGATTLVLQSKTTNQVALWYTSGTNLSTIPGGGFITQTPTAGWKVVGVGDFNGDGWSDLLFQNQTTNQVAIWFMGGTKYIGGVLMPYTPPAGWTVVGTGDFNKDGFIDIAFQNQSTGQIALWYLSGPNYVGGTVLTTVPASGWKAVGVGDYNGDGFADILFQNQTTNQAAIWYLFNGAFYGGDPISLTPPAGWKIVGPR